MEKTPCFFVKPPLYLFGKNRILCEDSSIYKTEIVEGITKTNKAYI